MIKGDDKATDGLTEFGEADEDLKEKLEDKEEEFVGSSADGLEHKSHPIKGIKRRFFSQAASVHKGYYTL